MAKAEQIKKIVVVGGGPAGMKAAVTAAERGHQVTLLERSEELGGQVKLARSIPTREEFGELVSNLKRELAFYRVDVRTGVTADKEMIVAMNPNEVIIATGATPCFPEIEGTDLPHVVTAWDVIERKRELGNKVVIADWKGDMPGVGTALYLSELGHDVELFTACYRVGFSIQQYIRDMFLAKLHLNNVKMTPHYRISKIEPGSVTFENIYSGQLVKREGIDSVVMATGHIQNTDLYYQLKDHVPNLHRIGECVSPRTAEEASSKALNWLPSCNGSSDFLL